MNIKFHIIDKYNLIKVLHKQCGNYVAYVKDASKIRRDSSNFYFLNGDQPMENDKIDIYCDKCRVHINKLADLVL